MTTSNSAAEAQPFQAEVSELLQLMVHSVYSETDPSQLEPAGVNWGPHLSSLIVCAGTKRPLKCCTAP
jgi:hypothetical protein